MKGNKLWYLVTLLAFAILPLAGCGGNGSGSQVKVGEKGSTVTVNGVVEAPKSTAKTVAAAATDLGTVSVIDAQDGTSLGTATVAADGKFSNLQFTLPSPKTILVFKAVVTQGTFRAIVPIDLSNPPAAGTVGVSNPISIVISQESTNVATLVSQYLGLTGLLGDTGMTLASVNKTYTDAAQLVVDNGGQALAYSGSGLALTGRFSSAALLPAQDANTLTLDELNSMTLNGSVISVAIPGNKPIVSFQVTNAVTGKGIRGLKSFGLAIAQLKPGANGSPDEWLSYMVASATSRPSTDSGYTVIDLGDGTYTVTFGKDIKTAQSYIPTYDASLTHRVVVQVRTTPSVIVQPNGSNLSNFYNEKILGLTFVPATPGVAPTLMRDITTTAACNECHTKIGVTTPHGGRGDVAYCMVCHTAQRANGRTPSTSTGGAFTGTTYVADGEVSGDFVTMVHKIHMGSKLTKTGYDYAGVKFNEIVYPKEITNCRQCHKGDTAAQLAAAPQANNWKTKPSRKTCGSCHDNITWATGANSKAGGTAHPAQTDDSFCVNCHGEGGPYPVEKFHLTTDASTNNPSVPTGLVNFTYDINSVAVDAATNQASVKFRILKDGAPVTFTGVGTTASPLLTGFTGGPSFLLAYNQSAPNQPFTASADYNNFGLKAAQPISVSIANLADGTKGTLGTPDASGYYTATITVAASNFPAGSKMRAVGLQGYFTQVSPAGSRYAISVVKAVTGDTVRRQVVDSAKCANCHEWFHGHGGNRVYEVQVCVMCHVPNLSTSGRGANMALFNFILGNAVDTSLATLIDPTTNKAYSGKVSQSAKDTITSLFAAVGSDPTVYPEETNNFKDMIHGIHAGSSRTNSLKFVRDRGTSGAYYYDFGFVKFPGILKNCQMCHTATGYTSVPADAQVTTDVTGNGTALDLTNNVVVVDAARKSLPNNADLVTTPFTATCVSCHDAPAAKAHMKQNGGQIKVLRSAADPSNEACVTCHGSTGTASIFNAHRY